jgi:hypothetical protein
MHYCHTLQACTTIVMHRTIPNIRSVVGQISMKMLSSFVPSDRYIYKYPECPPLPPPLSPLLSPSLAHFPGQPRAASVCPARNCPKGLEGNSKHETHTLLCHALINPLRSGVSFLCAAIFSLTSDPSRTYMASVNQTRNYARD